MTNYFIDTVGGDIGNSGLDPSVPKRTFQQLKDAYTLGPGDVFHYTPDSVETSQILPEGGGVPGNPQIFRLYPGTFGKWTIDTSDNHCFRGIGAGYIHCFDCRMINCANDAIRWSSNTDNTQNRRDGCLFERIEILNPGGYGIRWAGDGLIVRECDISSTQAGILLDGCNKSQVTRNKIHDYGRPGENDDGITIGNGSTDCEASFNEIWNSPSQPAQGIDISTGNGSFASGSVFGNYIHDIAGNGIGCNPFDPGYAFFYGNIFERMEVLLWPKGGRGDVWVIGNLGADANAASSRMSTSTAPLQPDNRYRFVGNVLVSPAGRPANHDFADASTRPLLLRDNWYVSGISGYQVDLGAGTQTYSSLDDVRSALDMEQGSIEEPEILTDKFLPNPVTAKAIWLPDLKDYLGRPIAYDGSLYMDRFIEHIRHRGLRSMFANRRTGRLMLTQQGLPVPRPIKVNEGVIRTDFPFQP